MNDKIPPLTNLYSNLPNQMPDELVDTLLESQSCRIERIVSHGHASPSDFWYDQPQNEWVVLLQGAASLQFELQDQPLALKSGDFVNIPAHQKHRVEWTTPTEPTIWLAIHYS